MPHDSRHHDRDHAEKDERTDKACVRGARSDVAVPYCGDGGEHKVESIEGAFVHALSVEPVEVLRSHGHRDGKRDYGEAQDAHHDVMTILEFGEALNVHASGVCVCVCLHREKKCEYRNTPYDHSLPSHMCIKSW